MNFIIIGLGNFGSSLGIRLANEGHEVLGIDHNPSKIALNKDLLTHCLQLDITDEVAVKGLPLKNADAIIIAIGENSSASITVAALLKKYIPSCRIIARSTSPIHTTVFQAMGIEEILNPETEYADQVANRLTIAGNLKTFYLNDEYEIVEFVAPADYIGKSVMEMNLVQKYRVTLVAIMRNTHPEEVNPITPGNKIVMVDGQSIFEKGDVLVLFGRIKDLDLLMRTGA